MGGIPGRVRRAGSLAVELLSLPYYVLAPSIDNWLGLRTRRDLRQFFEFGADGRPLRAIVEERVGPCEWCARHEGYIWATVVECLTRDAGWFRWEVSSHPGVPWLPSGLYVTPLTRAAAALVPEILPSGIEISSVPTDNFASAVIYQLAEPDKTREWLAPLLARIQYIDRRPPDDL